MFVATLPPNSLAPQKMLLATCLYWLMAVNRPYFWAVVHLRCDANGAGVAVAAADDDDVMWYRLSRSSVWRSGQLTSVILTTRHTADRGLRSASSLHFILPVIVSNHVCHFYPDYLAKNIIILRVTCYLKSWNFRNNVHSIYNILTLLSALGLPKLLSLLSILSIVMSNNCRASCSRPTQYHRA